MSAKQKDDLAFASKWIIGVLMALTGFVLSTSYVSITDEIKQQGKMMQDMNGRLIRVEAKMKTNEAF
jgi:hypothetical protein